MRGLALLKWGMSSKGEAQRAPSHAGLPPGEGGGGAGQLENQTDKGVVRPAAEGEDAAPLRALGAAPLSIPGSSACPNVGGLPPVARVGGQSILLTGQTEGTACGEPVGRCPHYRGHMLPRSCGLLCPRGACADLSALLPISPGSRAACEHDPRRVPGACGRSRVLTARRGLWSCRKAERAARVEPTEGRPKGKPACGRSLGPGRPGEPERCAAWRCRCLGTRPISRSVNGLLGAGGGTGRDSFNLGP